MTIDTSSQSTYIQALTTWSNGALSMTGTSGQAATIRYTFDSSDNFENVWLTSDFDATQRNSTRIAMEQWENVANVNFIEDDSNYDLVFAEQNLQNNVAGRTWITYSSNSEILYGDIFIDNSINDYNPGEFGNFVLIHEIGHFLGLSHPWANGPQAGFDNDETVMSYNEGQYANYSNDARSPMIYDIAAIQFLYGANTSYNSGNTIYDINGNNTEAYTIWDGGGTDEIRVVDTGTVYDALLDLREGFSSGGDQYVNSVGSSHVFIAYNATIENATGASGNDTIKGNNGANTLKGNGGTDQLFGFAGTDSLKGGDGNDTLDGGDDNDTLQGDNGNDILKGRDGNDVLEGGDGQDTLFGLEDNDTIYGDAGNDRLVGDVGQDWLYGGINDDLLEGGDDGDHLYGEAGNDLLKGQLGNDTMEGGAGIDKLFGELGDDVLRGNEGNDILDGQTGDDVLEGNEDNDTLKGGHGDDTLDGGSGNDRLYAQSDNDVLRGGAGNDVLDAGDGNDLLEGGDGDDFLNGRNDNDTLDGGAGVDTLYSGTGSDVFRFSALTDSIHSAFDTISDFTQGLDLIDISALGFTSITEGTGGGGILGYTTNGSNVYLQDADSAFFVRVVGVSGLSDADFILT